MRTRTWTLLAAITLLLAGAVALATSVQSQDFERQAVTDQDGAAYSVDWQSHEPGMLRLALAPNDDATSPHATVSLLKADGTVQGTYTLDDEWPRLDVRLEPSEEQLLFIHRAHDAQITILAEEGHPINWNHVDTTTTTTPLTSAQREPIKTQIVVENDHQPIHMTLGLDGAVHDLAIAANNPEDQTVLHATVEHADTSAGHQLAPTLAPAAFQDGPLHIQLEANELDGTLNLTTHYLNLGIPNVVHPEGASTQGEPSAPNQTEAKEETPPPLIEVRTLNPSTPLGLTVPDTQTPVHIASEDHDARLILFGPDDAYLGTVALDQEPPEDANEEAKNGSWATLPLDATGEHVIVLEARGNATLYAPPEEAIHHRGIDRVEHQAQVTPDEEGFTMRSNATATVDIPGGVFDFAWTSNGLDIKRDIELLGPGNETLYEATAVTADRAKVFSSHETASPLAGPIGMYTVATETTSAYDRGIKVTITHYER